ncbi:MAG: alpha-L-fucosidase [Sediminibacterium sp.]
MKKIMLAFLVLLSTTSFAQKIKPVLPVPTKEHLAWHEKEFYLFIHFGPNTFTDKEWGDGKEDPTVFAPTQLDCNQWVRVAKLAGAKGIILTAKHHDGFSLWPSKYSTHTVRESKWLEGKGDVVRMLSDACKKGGLEMGVYISPWDRNHPDYGTPKYNDIYIATMKELLTGYGKFFELWWDGANGEGPNGKKQEYTFRRFEDSAFAYQPHLMIFSDIGPSIRWCGNERGIIGNTNWNLLDTAGFYRGHGGPLEDTLNQGNVNGKLWIPAEADVSIRPGWFYHTKEDNKVKSPNALFNLFLKSVGNGGNLLLNVPPDRRGLFHEADSASLVGFAELRKKAFEKNLLAGMTPATKTTANGLVTLTYTFKKATKLNAVVLQELIEHGQRVKSFTIEAKEESAFGKTNNYFKIFDGTTIGRKKIATFDPITTTSIKITITDAKAAVYLKPTSAYDFGFEVKN